MKRIGFASLAIVPALAFSATARAQLDRFQGAWDNTNAETRGIVRIRIDTAKVQVYGACHPNPCDWGQAEATAYGPGVSADLQTEARALLVHYKTAFSETILIIKPAGTDELEVESYTRFIDGSRRAAYMNRETFRRGAKANAPGNTESRRIQNIAPEEMWKRVTQCAFPRYSNLAFANNIAGTVDIGLAISPEGDVANTSRVLDGPPLLVSSAMDAIRQWKFQPNMVQGEMTWSRVRALVRFNADGTTAVELAPAILADNFGDPGSPRSSASAFPRPESSPECKSAADPTKQTDDYSVSASSGGGDVGPVRVGTVGVGHPTCIYCPIPQYSAEARNAKIQGNVVLSAVIEADGHATNIKVVRGLGHGLDEKATEAVETWRFNPAVGPNGNPVATITSIEVSFRFLKN